jgi:thioredoxin reductase
VALGIRINGQESREGGYDLLGFREMMDHVAATGALDFVNVDVGHSWGSPSYVQPSYYGHAVYREVGRALKVDLDGIKVLFSGRVNDPGIAEQLLREGCADLVGMTRAGIADPDFANKAREGRVGEIRRCIGCNRCIGQTIRNDAPDMFKKPVCSVNPEIGNELFFALTKKKADVRRRLLVVGGGPAGLETARVAAERGHEVVLFERAPKLGGQLDLAARAPGRDAFDDFTIFQTEQLARLGVDVRLGAAVGVDEILALRPDAVACATGSRPRWPDTPSGLEREGVVQGWDVLAGRAELGDRVAVISQEDHFETPNVADYAALHAGQVEIFHKWTQIGAQIDRYTIGPVMTQLAEKNVRIHTGLRLAAVCGGKLELVSSFGGRRHVFDGFDTVVLVYGSVPDPSLYYSLRQAQRESGGDARLFLVGSAWVPRLMAEATLHGAKVGMEI